MDNKKDLQNEKKEKDKGKISKESSIDSIAQFNINQLLNGLNENLSSLNKRVSELESPNKGFATRLLEYIKVIASGWPAFGLIFLLLFYSPLKEALASIPEKVRNANEISVGGVSLKSKIQEVAKDKGDLSLASVIPELSSSALEQLLKSPKRNTSDALFAYSSDENEKITTFYMPSPNKVFALEELKSKDLISLSGEIEASDFYDSLEAGGLTQLILEIKSAFPGTIAERYIRDEIKWELESPIEKDKKYPGINWTITDSGQDARQIILEAVAQELSQSGS